MNDLKLQEALMHPDVDLDYFLSNFKTQLQDNYEATALAVVQLYQEQKRVINEEIDQFAKTVIETDVTDAPNKQITLLKERLLEIKNEQNHVEKILEEKKNHLEETERLKSELSRIYQTTASKINSVRPTLICDKELHKAAHEALKYTTCRNHGYSYANQRI